MVEALVIEHIAVCLTIAIQRNTLRYYALRAVRDFSNSIIGHPYIDI